MSLTRTLELLEFETILTRVAECSVSAEASKMILDETKDELKNERNDVPSGDPLSVPEKKALVASVCELLKKDRDPQLALPEIGFLLPALDVQGAALALDEAFAIGLFTERGEIFRTSLLKSESPLLREASETIPSCAEIAAEIFRIIDKDGNMKDLPEIKKIRRRISDLSKELEQSAARLSANEEIRRMLQSPLPSQRDGRLVLALKANYRGRIKGIVHEVSSSGQTIFVEPEESVEKNNLLLVEKGNLEAQIRKILRELTGKLAGKKDTLEAFHTKILYFETLRAKARYSLDTKGCFAAEGELNLKDARHPLLGTAAVPVNLSMDEETRMVIITGPNTGGKTVALKTIGLFALMNQCALALPAAEGTSMPLFDAVFADIGDEQSITQSLSTFSAHMVNIAGIVSQAGQHSLVLLDELGSGTDPEEGSAIAMALLDHFIEKKTTVVVTTHHGVLKNYGYSRQGVENASVEFDGRTLSPTYRIIMGIPGESRALDIAGRNGLPQDLIKAARLYLEDGRSDVSALITGLKEKHRELESASQKAGMEEQRLREERRKADLKELSLRQKEHQLKTEAAFEFRRLLADSRKKLENLVRELREGEISRDKTLRVKEFIKGLEEDSAAIDAALEAEQSLVRIEDTNAVQGNIQEGDEVTALWQGKERRGRVVRKDNKGGAGNFWIVETGSVKIRLSESDLTPLGNTSSGKSAGDSSNMGKPLISTAELTSSAEAKIEINLIGMRLEEALETLRRQLDAALISGLQSFSIVHGKGSGILQKGVHDYLKEDYAVADYYFSRPESGGFGRTEVVLKS